MTSVRGQRPEREHRERPVSCTAGLTVPIAPPEKRIDGLLTLPANDQPLFGDQAVRSGMGAPKHLTRNALKEFEVAEERFPGHDKTIEKHSVSARVRTSPTHLLKVRRRVYPAVVH